MAGKRHTLLSVRLYVPMCVCCMDNYPYCVPRGVGQQTGGGVGGVGIKGWGAAQKKKLEEY